MVHWPIDSNSMAHYTDKVDPDSIPSTAKAFMALKKLQAAGKIKHIGVSNFGVNQLKEALATGARLSVNQLCYNLIFRAIEFEILPFCKKNGIGIVCYSPLMQGLLTGRWKSADEVPTYRARSRHFNGNRDKSRHGEKGHEKLLFKTLASIEKISQSSGLSMLDLALAWPLRQKAVTSVIVGVTKQEQLPSNCKAVAAKIPAKVMKQLDEATAALKNAMGSNADNWQGAGNSRCN